MAKLKTRKTKPARNVVVAQEHGSPMLRQHAQLVVDETMAAGITRARIKHECRLDWYWDRMLITDRQRDSGIRFRRDWLVATAERHLTSSYGQRIAGHGEFTEAQIAARRRIERALAALVRAEVAVVIKVCGMDEWAAGMLPALRDALTVLADQYGLPK